MSVRVAPDQRQRITLTLNGKVRSGFAEPRMLLTDFLRHVLGATGTHVGCEHGVCGACTVEIDGVAARACEPSKVWRPRRGGCRYCRTRSGGTTPCSAASARRAS